MRMFKRDRRKLVREKSKALEELRKLTESLTTLPEMIVYTHDCGVEYQPVGDGEITGYYLFNKPEVSVQRVFMAKGTKFPNHFHPSIEYGVVYKGKMEVLVDGKVKVYSTGDCMIFQSNQEHSGKAIEDCWVVFIAVPAAEGYPNGK